VAYLCPSGALLETAVDIFIPAGFGIFAAEIARGLEGDRGPLSLIDEVASLALGRCNGSFDRSSYVAAGIAMALSGRDGCIDTADGLGGGRGGTAREDRCLGENGRGRRHRSRNSSPVPSLSVLRGVGRFSWLPLLLGEVRNNLDLHIGEHGENL